MNDLRLKKTQLSWKCDLELFEFESTAELPRLEETIGQKRALQAIDFGLGIKDNGFNLFILGQPGSGRSSTIKKILHRHAAQRDVPDDWCYIFAFDQAEGPEYIRLPAGKGRSFKEDVDHLVDRLAEEVSKSFESKEYTEQKKRITQHHTQKKNELFKGLEQTAKKKNFTIQQMTNGFVLVPLQDGEPMSKEEYDSLADSDKETLEHNGKKLQEQLDDVLLRIRKIDEEEREAMLDMGKEMLNYTIGHLFEPLIRKYHVYYRVLEFFEQCKKDIINQIDELSTQKKQRFNLAAMTGQQQGPSFDRYRVNLLIDNSDLKGAPVIYEANPTYFNIFGRIEHIIQMGSATTNFQMIKPGALHHANGGYLILDCREVLLNLFTYEALKRCIRNGEIKIEDMAEQYRLIATVSLKPQPIPLNCKIILIGTPMLYYLLYQLDPDFRKYFKVKVDFNQMMKNTRENAQQLALFIATKCHEEHLTHFSRAAVAATVEYAARLIGDQRQLSSSFFNITDLIREAAYYAYQDSAETVGAQHVEHALEARTYRSNSIEERLREMITDDTLLIDTQGSFCGRVNGLSVYQPGDYSFGMPVRVSVRTYAGKGGMINIEREAKLSGPVHDKGIMILNGFFGERYGRDKLLSLSASICFEQSYSGIEGDSASSTELYALLSSLSGLPVRQGIAVTGSVNQHGQVQAIGGVNEKIEGFFDLCKTRGLSGDQGVIIPAANIKNLMLKKEVLTAVQENQFHIWAVNSIDQGISILTDTPAGKRNEDGTWEPETLNAMVDSQLQKMAELAEKNDKAEEDKSGKANH